MHAKPGTTQADRYRVFELRFVGSSVIETLVWCGDSPEKLAQDHPRDDSSEAVALVPRKIPGGNLNYRFEYLVNGAYRVILEPRAIFLPNLTVNPFSLEGLAGDHTFNPHQPDRDSKWMRGD